MPDRNDQDSRCDQLLRSRLRREQSRRLPRGLSARDTLTMMQKQEFVENLKQSYKGMLARACVQR